MAYKSVTVIVTTRVRARLRLIATPLFGLVLLSPEKVLSLALDRVADLGKSEAAGAF